MIVSTSERSTSILSSSSSSCLKGSRSALAEMMQICSEGFMVPPQAAEINLIPSNDARLSSTEVQCAEDDPFSVSGLQHQQGGFAFSG